MSATELKPCPFCESREHSYGTRGGEHVIICDECNSSAPDEVWNTRSAEDAIVERIAAYVESLAGAWPSLMRQVANDIRARRFEEGKS